MRNPAPTVALAAALAVSAFSASAFGENVKAPVTMTDTGAALTATEAQAWIGKPVYSNDGTKLGEVALVERDADNRLTGIRADVGGYLGLGQHRIMLAPAQFILRSDRVVLHLTAEQAKELSRVAK
jgi:hypothetical protein